MNFRNLVGGLVAVVATVVAFTAPARANDPLLNFLGNQLSPNADFVFTSNGAGGGLLSTQGIGTIVTASSQVPGTSYGNTAAYLNFGPISQIAGSATLVGNTLSADFSGGSFSFWTGANSTGTLLLEGTFNKAQFISTSSSSATVQSDSFVFNDVTYTGGTVLTEYLAYKGGSDPRGNFGVGLTALTARGLAAGNGLRSFNANGSGGTFDITTVPEPGEYAAMALIALTIGGLMVRARFNNAA